MRILLLTALVFFISPILKAEDFLSDKECRKLIVEAYDLLGDKVEPDSFSTNEFSDFNISIEQFNALTASEQVDIYRRIKPLAVVVQEVIDEINGQINRYAGTFYEYFMAEQMQQWRAKKDELRGCNPQKRKLKLSPTIE